MFKIQRLGLREVDCEFYIRYRMDALVSSVYSAVAAVAKTTLVFCVLSVFEDEVEPQRAQWRRKQREEAH